MFLKVLDIFRFFLLKKKNPDLQAKSLSNETGNNFFPLRFLYLYFLYISELASCVTE